jgi:two-component system sensor histidine kinase CpxA
MKRLIGRFSSIGVKLFLCFWLITITSIAATRIISEQFWDSNIILPTHLGDLRKLNRLEMMIKRKSPRSPTSLLKLWPRRMEQDLLLKNIKTNEITNAKQNPEFHLKIMPEYYSKKFLTNNTLTSMTTVELPFLRITGPLNVTIGDNAYQVFLQNPSRNQHFSTWLFRLPAWTRISIPITFSLFLSWLLARSLTKPLITMQKTAAKFGDGDFSARVALNAQRNDEIGDCAQSFNLMAEKLEQNINAHQRLLADVSHELRSPMTRLQIALGLAQHAKGTPDELDKHIARCELEVSRLDDMIGNVLKLSRMENTITDVNLMSVDLTQLIQLSIDDAQYIANDKHINISFSALSPHIIQADPNLLASAFNNILINAVKYSPENAPLKVNIQSEDARYVIEFIDSGIGVPEHELSMLFKPFYRVAQSRERASGGTGLGLAIAQQAVVAHQGKIQAINNEKNGLTVIIELPKGFTKHDI